MQQLKVLLTLCPRRGHDLLQPESTPNRAAHKCHCLVRLGPGEIRKLVTEPGSLPLGVAPGIALTAFRRLVERNLAVEIADQPRHPMRLHCRQRCIEAALRQYADLVERA